MEEMSKDFLARMQAAAAHGPTLEEVKANPTPHGKLVSCSYYASSQGMMYNSNSLLNISAALLDGVQKITCTDKPAYQSTTLTVYLPKQDVLAAVQALAERENLAAWSALEYHNPFQCTDYSSSASISLTFDDRSVGGSGSTYIHISIDAACQHGGGDVVQEFRNILETAMLDAEVLSRQVTEASTFGLGLLTAADLQAAAAGSFPNTIHPGAWKCPKCGCASNTGKFCTECGHPKEPEASCG